MAGERDGVKLAQLRDRRCKSSEETIAKALTGTWKEEHLFALKQSLELYDFYTRQVANCDAQIQQQYAVMKPRWHTSPDNPVNPISTSRHKRHTKNGPPLEVEDEIIRITGVSIAAVDGIGAGLAQTILSEIGTDMSKWPSEKHFTSWLGVAPHNAISGGKVLHSRTLPTRNRAGQAFRQAATSVSHSSSAFGASARKAVHYMPKWQPPIRSLERSTTCSNIMSNTKTWEPRNLNADIGNGTLRRCARRPPNLALHLSILSPFSQPLDSPR